MAHSLEQAVPPERAPAARPGEEHGAPARAACRADAPVTCPACNSPMRLWAAYYRCRNCGYKESCCF